MYNLDDRLNHPTILETILCSLLFIFYLACITLTDWFLDVLYQLNRPKERRESFEIRANGASGSGKEGDQETVDTLVA